MIPDLKFTEVIDILRTQPAFKEVTLKTAWQPGNCVAIDRPRKKKPERPLKFVCWLTFRIADQEPHRNDDGAELVAIDAEAPRPEEGVDAAQTRRIWIERNRCSPLALVDAECAAAAAYLGTVGRKGCPVTGKQPARRPAASPAW